MAMFQENLSSHSLVPHPEGKIMLVPRKPVGFSSEHSAHNPKTSRSTACKNYNKRHVTIKRRPVGAGFPQWFSDKIKLPTSATFPESLTILGRFDHSRPLRREISVPRVPVPKRQPLLERWSIETFELSVSSLSGLSLTDDIIEGI